MKHCLLIFPHLRSKHQFGGQRSRHVVDALGNNGLDVTVIVPLKDTMTGLKSQAYSDQRLVYKETMSHYTVMYANSLDNNRNSLLARLLYVFTLSFSMLVSAIRKRKVDLVVSVSLPFTFMLAGYVVSKLRKVPHVIEVRDIGISVAGEIGVVKKGWLYRNVIAVENFFYRSADSLIVVSEGFKKRLSERGVAEDKINIVELGYDGYEEDDSANEVEWTLPQDKFVVLYSGTLGYVFNIDLLLAAAKKLRDKKNILFVILGGGQNLRKFRHQAETDGLNIKFLGNRPKREVAYYCRAADVCVYPAKNGTNVNSMLGNKIFDYMGSGTATIYSGQGGDVSELLQRSGGGVVCQGNAESLSHAILGLYKDGEKLAEMGENAKRFIYNGYLSKNMAESYASIVAEQAEKPVAWI